jgi:hypothetical protein
MSYFDPKEEVLDIQLTKYGRHRLSKGEWKPKYYAFFDDNIIYDFQHAGVTESKNNAETRIQDETPSLKTQGNYTGRDEYLFDGVNDLQEQIQLNIYEKLNTLPYQLGTSKLGSEKTPAFKLRYLEGKIDDLGYNSTGSIRVSNTGSVAITPYSQQLIKIPQIESDIEFKITVNEFGSPPPLFEIDEALTPGKVYLDNTEVFVGPEQLLFILEEVNADFDYNNFDIEVYEITEQVGPLGEPVLIPMTFRKPIQKIKNNILLSDRVAAAQAGYKNGKPLPLDPTNVEYYFNINVDDEIDSNIICRSINQLKSTDLFNDLEIDCPDLKTPIRADIYSSTALDEDCPEY